MFTLLQAAAPAGQQGGGWSMWIMLALIFVVMWFFMIRPQKKQQKELQNFRDSLKKGDKVVIVSCEMNPQYVGKIGKVESVLGTDDNALIKVSHKGKMIPDYATADCLIKMEE